MKVCFHCAHCHRQSQKEAGAINRARRSGLRLFCGRRCSGLTRRKGKTKAQRVAEKREYDMAYRAANLATIKEKKRLHYQATRDPEKERAYRKAHMARHVKYCRRPEYRAYKREYDKKHRAREYGPFADCFLILQDLNAEIAARMSRYDIYMANSRFERYHEKRKQRRLTSEEFHRR